MRFHLFSTLVAISSCSFVSAKGVTGGLFASSSDDAPSYNQTSSVDIAQGVNPRFGKGGYTDRGPILSLVSVSKPSLCVQPARLQEGAGVELLKCVRNSSFKQRQGWNFHNGKLRHNINNIKLDGMNRQEVREDYKNMCVTVQTEQDNFLLHELIMGPCGNLKNPKARFIYYPHKHHLRWAADQRYYVTNLGTALYLRKRISTGHRGQKWVFFRGWANPQGRTANLLYPQPANETQIPIE